jgi:hypothetical protein
MVCVLASSLVDHGFMSQTKDFDWYFSWQEKVTFDEMMMTSLYTRPTH